MSFQPEGVDTIENLNGMDFECGNCLKKYKQKSSYHKHITAGCRQATKVEKSNNEIDDPKDVPEPVLVEQFDADTEICLLRGKPLKEHSMEAIRKELKKRRLNVEGTKPVLIERLEENVLGKRIPSLEMTKSQSRSNVVLDPWGKQCFHCGIKQKVLPYIVPKNGTIYHYCSAECRFSPVQIPKHEDHDGGGEIDDGSESTKSQNDNPTFFGAEENGQGPASPPTWPRWPTPPPPILTPYDGMEDLDDDDEHSMKKRRSSHVEKFLDSENVMPSKLRSEIK